MREVDVVTGCLLLVRRALWERLGGFDERFFMYGEDTDLALRAARLGYRPAITPDAVVTHEIGVSSASRPEKYRLVLQAKLMVMEKHKDIAILVSMGASRRSIMRVFMLQGVVIGVIGTAIGGFLGIGACYVLDRFQLVRVPESVYQIAWVPFRLQPLEAALVLAVALLICFVATLYPSRGAARLDPAEALRYE